MADNNVNVTQDQDFYGAVRFFGTVELKLPTTLSFANLILPLGGKIYFDGGVDSYIANAVGSGFDIAIVCDTTAVMYFRQAQIQINTILKGTGSSAYLIFNVPASATQPTLIPNETDVNTGIGHNTADELSLIAGGTEALRLTQFGIEEKVVNTVVPNNNDDANSSIPTTGKRVFVDPVTNDANDWIVLPRPSLGKELWVICSAGSNFEIRTESASGYTINDINCSDDAREYLATDGDMIHFIATSDTSWIGISYTALGAVRTAVIPD